MKKNTKRSLAMLHRSGILLFSGNVLNLKGAECLLASFLIGLKCPLAVSMSLKINLSRQLSTGVEATNKDKRKKGVLYEWRQHEVFDLLEI